MKQSYTVVYGPTWWECQVEIDPEFITPVIDKGRYWTTTDCIKSMVEFWTGYENRLKANNDDYTKTFLQQLAREICYILTDNNLNLYGVIKEFKDREGWSPMDGSYGVEIVEIDTFSFEYTDFEVTEDPS